MMTGHLIELLSRQAGPAPRHSVERRIAIVVTFGASASAAGAVGALGLNDGLANMDAAIAAKFVYVLALTLCAVWFVDRVSRPGTPFRRALDATAAVVLTMGLFAVCVWTQAEEAQRLDLVLGRTWSSCPWLIAGLSVPAFGVVIWALRGLAPTKPRWAGFAAGLLSGSLGALGYALHCPELSPLFVLGWYTTGVLLPAALGTLLGPMVLRW